ncbi:uncharacterized protein LOC120330129 [Styela clava]
MENSNGTILEAVAANTISFKTVLNYSLYSAVNNTKMNTTALTNLTKLNSSAPTVVEHYEVEIWLTVCQIIEGILLVVTIWILVSMIMYGYKAKKFERKGGTPWLNGRNLYVFCVVSVTSIVVRFAWAQVVIEVPRRSDSSELCEAIIDITGISYTMCLGTVYVFLWLRQRTIYTNPKIRKLTGNCANYLSWISMILLCIVAAVLTCIITAPMMYRAGPHGCIIKEGVNYEVYYALVSASLFLFQFALLGLFIYPITKNTTSKSDFAAKHDSSDHPENTIPLFRFCTPNGQHLNKVEKMIRRSVISTCVAVASDVTSMLVVNYVTVPVGLPISVGVTLYDVSILINVFCMLMTFGSHRRILTVLCGHNNKKVPGSSTETDECA